MSVAREPAALDPARIERKAKTGAVLEMSIDISNLANMQGEVRFEKGRDRG